MKIDRLTLRGARVMLDLEQDEVAHKTGISKQRISNYERGHDNSDKTYSALESFYEQYFIFDGSDGLKRRPAFEVRPALKGTDGFRRFMDEVYAVASTIGGRIEIINGHPELFIQWLGAEWYANHAVRMEKIKDHLNFRIITHEKQNNLIARSFAQYKTVPKDLFNTQTIYIYGDHVAFFNFTEEEVSIQVIQQPELIRTFHLMFDLLWDYAT